MRRALILTLLFAVGGCSKPKFDPVLPGARAAIEREVLELIDSTIEGVRRAPSDARAHATLGLVYEANEQWDEAARSLANAIAIDDSQPLWIFHRGLALHEGGQVEAAVTELREAGRRMVDNAAVQQRLGYMLLDLGDPVQARAAFERALAAAPGAPECLAGMAAVEIASERWSEALMLAQRALELDSSYGHAAYLAGLALQGVGREAEARDHLASGMGARRRWLGDPLTVELSGYRLTVGGLMESAGQAATTGNLARAVALYEKVLARRPTDAEVINNMSASLIDMGQLGRAEVLLEGLLRRNPDSFAAHLNFAALALKRQDLERARRHADLAVTFGGSVGRTHFMRGHVMMLQGEWLGAEKELRTTVELDARNPQHYLALAAAVLERDQVDEARELCRKAIAIDPKLLPAQSTLCSLALRAGDVAEARAAFAVLDRMAPSHEETVALRKQIQKLPK